MTFEDERLEKLRKGGGVPNPTMIKTGGVAPEWGRCRKTGHAKFSDPDRQVRAEEKRGKLRGKYEFFPIPS